MKFIETKSYDELSRKAAGIIAAQVQLFPNSTLGLATGSTPIGTYKNLTEWYKNGDIDFSSIKSVNLDEYCGLNTENENSYRYFMNNNLFNHINIKKENTYVPNGLAADVKAECNRYDELINSLGGVDLQLLGLGNNGHIGFNEPSDKFETATHCVTLAEETINANMRFFKTRDEVPTSAITVGMKAIMQAKKVLLIVSGKAKHDILNKALYGDVAPEVPASILQLHPDLTVIYDSES